MLKTLISVALEINLQLLFNTILHHDALPIMTAMVLQDHFCFLLLAFSVYACNFAPDGPIFLIFLFVEKRMFTASYPDIFIHFQCLFIFYILLFLGNSQHTLKLQGCWKEASKKATNDWKLKKWDVSYLYMYCYFKAFLF